MKVEFRGAARDDRHGGSVLIEGAVDGRPVRFRFTRDAIRSVAPAVADDRDLLARLSAHEDQFAAVLARKLRAAGGAVPEELVVTEADVLAGADGGSGEVRWSDDGGWPEPAENPYA